MGFATEWDAFTDTTPLGTRNFRNLIATFDESAPRRLVLACHYDSKIIPGQVMIAATDSAVPCAMMLDIAQTLAPYMYKRVAQQIGLQLIFFDGEEAFRDWTATDSLYGSRFLNYSYYYEVVGRTFSGTWHRNGSKSGIHLQVVSTILNSAKNLIGL